MLRPADDVRFVLKKADVPHGSQRATYTGITQVLARLRRQDGLDRLKMWLSDNSVSRNPNELTNKVEVRIVVTVP